MKQLRILVLFGFGLGLCMLPQFVSAQGCFSGGTWVAPGGNPPTANRVQPVYSSCANTQEVQGNVSLNASTGATDEAGLFITHNATDDFPALQATVSVGSLVAQFGTSAVYGNNASGQTLRIQDITNNPELQLQYGPGADDHWSIYANTAGDDSLRIWGYNSGFGDDRLTILQSGRIGVGTTTPTETLSVEGSFQLFDGTQADGYVLVSNNTGVASWQPATSLEGSYWSLNGTDLYPQQTSWDVGIGTQSPQTNLDIHNAIGPRLLFTRADTGTTQGQYFGQILFDSTSGAVNTNVGAPVVIRAIASENQSSGNKGGELKILTRPNGASNSTQPTERLYIQNDGDVIVGGPTGAGGGPGGSLFVNLQHDSAPYEKALYVTRQGSYNQGLKVYATDRDLYLEYNEDTGESAPGTIHFINQISNGQGGSVSQSTEYLTARFVSAPTSTTFVGINQTNPQEQLHVGGSVKVDNDVYAVTYYASSDERLKKNINSLDTKALDQLLDLNPVTFEWKDDIIEFAPTGTVHGLIAQEVEKIFPDMVQTMSSGYKTVSYDQLIPVMIKSIQEQQVQIDDLTKRLEALEHRSQ